MQVTLTSPPAALPVSVTDARVQCRIDDDVEDDLLQSYIAAATGHLDGIGGVLGLALVTQVWTVALDGWRDRVLLPIEPVQSIAVEYDDANGDTIVPDLPLPYELVRAYGAGASVVLRPGFAPPALAAARYPVRILVTAGFGAAADVPDPLRVAILQMVGHWHANREAVVTGTPATELPLSVAALIAPYRRHF